MAGTASLFDRAIPVVASPDTAASLDFFRKLGFENRAGSAFGLNRPAERRNNGARADKCRLTALLGQTSLRLV